MKSTSSLLLAFALFMGTIVSHAFAGDADPLFINLISDEPHRAEMALTFGGNQHSRGHALTIFLNDRAVLVASTANAGKYSKHQQKLSDLLEEGATVLICAMCMNFYGVEEADLLPGVEIGNPELTGGALFKDSTKTLTW